MARQQHHANDIMIYFRANVVADFPKTSQRLPKENEIGDKSATIGDKSAINPCQKILEYLAEHPASKTIDIANYIGLKISRTKDYISMLVKEDKIVPFGENKNRVYSLKEESKCEK